jgi:hypothetical protein
MKLLALSIILFPFFYVTAQDCKNYLFLQNGKTVEMTIYNKKGEENGKQVYKISNYKGSGSSATATITTEMFDKKGKSITTATNQVQCTGGVMKMDMKMSMPGDQAQKMKVDANAQSFFIDYPAKMKEGDALDDGSMQMDMDINGSGLKQSVTMNVTNRKVEGKESITTTAGTWECYKITSHMKMTVKTMAIPINFNSDNVEWFAPGVGIIKTTSKWGGTAITAIN